MMKRESRVCGRKMKRAPNQPVESITIYAGIFLKTWTVADAGTLVPQHSHAHPHISFLVSGSIRVWCDDELLGDFAAPVPIKIAEFTKHRFLTLTDNVVIGCIHAIDGVGEVPIHEEHTLEIED